MKKSSTKTTRSPSKASLRELPEVDLIRYRPVGRGRHVDKARRSFSSVLVDARVLRILGGQEAVSQILATLANGVEAGRKHRAA